MNFRKTDHHGRGSLWLEVKFFINKILKMKEKKSGCVVEDERQFKTDCC